MRYFTYLYCLGNASWHTKLKFNYNHSEVRPESTSENKTQDIINGLEMTGADVSFCYFMLSSSTLSKFNTYHYILLCIILSSLLLYSYIKTQVYVAVLNLKHQTLTMTHYLECNCKLQYFLAFFFYRTVTKIH